MKNIFFNYCLVDSITSHVYEGEANSEEQVKNYRHDLQQNKFFPSTAFVCSSALFVSACSGIASGSPKFRLQWPRIWNAEGGKKKEITA